MLDVADVGMTAMLAADSAALARVARAMGRLEEARELEDREHALQAALGHMWDDESSLYFNKRWRTSTRGGPWGQEDEQFVEPKIATPTSFYPMLTRTPTATQVNHHSR